MKLIQFGEIIPNLKIHNRIAPYPVLNERDARAAAGLMLIFAIFAFVNALLLQETIFLRVTVILFALEFALRIFINPKLSPFYYFGSLLVKNQIPEYTGAAQKRFAWALGFILALIMIFVIFVFGIKGTIPFIICSICLILLWFETSFGICIGCKIYKGFISLKIIQEPEHMPACPGGVCELKN